MLTTTNSNKGVDDNDEDGNACIHKCSSGGGIDGIDGSCGMTNLK